MKRIVFLSLITCIFVLIGCSQQPSDKVLLYEENNEIIGPERDEIVGEISDTIYDSIDRSNANAQEIMIGPIEGTGEDITPPEGRYTITGQSPNGNPQSGRLLVYDENGTLLIDELIDYGYGVGSVTVDLNGSHTVHIDGLDQAAFTPTPTQISNQLSAGIWEVGTDIEAGSYSVMADSEFAYGDLIIFEEGKTTRVFEVLNTTPESKIDVTLTEGQKLKISGLSLLQFEPQS
jgi:hypothetical protein